MPNLPFNITVIEEAYQLHLLVKDNYHNQMIVNITTWAVMAALLIPSLFIAVRIYWIKERAFLALLMILLIIGELAGLSVAYCIYELFKICDDFKTLLTTDPSTLNRLFYGNAYSVGVFLTCFNVAHWLFAMQYWSLSLRLTQLVSR